MIQSTRLLDADGFGFLSATNIVLDTLTADLAELPGDWGTCPK